MDLKLKGKRALVTGSTQGIGFAIALGLAREGAEVVLNGRTDAKVGEAVKRIAGETSAAVTGIAGDLGNAAEASRLIEQLGPVVRDHGCGGPRRWRGGAEYRLEHDRREVGPVFAKRSSSNKK